MSENVNITVSHGKTIYKIPLSPSSTVLDLKNELQTQSGIAASLQKLLAKGSMLKDDQQVSTFGEKTKIILMASASKDIAKVAAAALSSIVSPVAPAAIEIEYWAEKTEHAKILSKGLPPDVMPGIIGTKESLPERGIVGLWNSYGAKTRLTFKYDELVIGTNGICFYN